MTSNNPTWILPIELPLDAPPQAKVISSAPVFLPVTPKSTERIPTSHGSIQEEDLEDDDDIPDHDSPHGTLWRWFFWSASFLLGGLIIEEMWTFLLAQYHMHPAMGIFFALSLLFLSAALITAIAQEIMALRAIKKRNFLRHEAERLIAEDTFGQAMPLLGEVTDLYRDRQETRESLIHFRSLTRDHLGDQELLALFSSKALQPLDEAVLRIIGRHAAAAALFSVISPLAILDVLVFFWRNIRMVREISRIYGLRPGMVGSILLMRNVAEGMVAAGVGELITDSMTDTLGDALTEAALSGAGQAATNALFTMRTGLQTMIQCRPIPFPAAQKPGLNQIRQAFKAAISSAKSAT
ncbi:MAG: TIGR01620 family protein [Magnetococcus sp. YQC-5]